MTYGSECLVLNKRDEIKLGCSNSIVEYIRWSVGVASVAGTISRIN